MSALFALVAAVAFGLSDFIAGLLSRRASVFSVTVVGQSASAALTWIATPFGGGSPSAAAYAWGAVSGIGSVGGAMFLYRGLAAGRMSVVGPVSAVVTALGSAVAGIAMGERPAAPALVGMGAACAAVGLVSAGGGGSGAVSSGTMRASLLDAFAAGLGFVLFFVALHLAGTSAGLWPVAIGQSAGLLLAVCGLGVLITRRRVRPGDLRRVVPEAASVGVLGGGATVAYFVATHAGLLSVTAVITSLYPAATVIPAMLLLRERTRRLQTAGLLLAALSVVLLAV